MTDEPELDNSDICKLPGKGVPAADPELSGEITRSQQTGL